MIFYTDSWKFKSLMDLTLYSWVHSTLSCLVLFNGVVHQIVLHVWGGVKAHWNSGLPANAGLCLLPSALELVRPHNGSDQKTVFSGLIYNLKDDNFREEPAEVVQHLVRTPPGQNTLPMMLVCDTHSDHNHCFKVKHSIYNINICIFCAGALRYKITAMILNLNHQKSNSTIENVGLCTEKCAECFVWYTTRIRRFFSHCNI